MWHRDSKPQMNKGLRIALTGFMGVGKSSVARHLASRLKCNRIDLDSYIERSTGRTIPDILRNDGEPAYRVIETNCLREVLEKGDCSLLSLGGGTWTIEQNRQMIRERGIVSVWLDASFDHCWQNIRKSRKERPLAKNKDAALALFEKRQSIYCLADWHFRIRPESTSYDVAKQIIEEVFS